MFVTARSAHIKANICHVAKSKHILYLRWELSVPAGKQIDRNPAGCPHHRPQGDRHVRDPERGERWTGDGARPACASTTRMRSPRGACRARTLFRRRPTDHRFLLVAALPVL